MKSSVQIFSLLFVVLFGGFANAQAPPENRDLPNFAIVNEQVWRGAQPTAAGIKQLAARGVKTIVNLRGADERALTEAEWAREANVNFINIPLENWFRPKDDEIEKILAVINDSQNQPVFVHCRRGADRTGTVIAAYRISHDDWTAEAAEDEAKHFGFGWWQIRMRDFIKDYYRDLHKQPAANQRND